MPTANPPTPCFAKLCRSRVPVWSTAVSNSIIQFWIKFWIKD